MYVTVDGSYSATYKVKHSLVDKDQQNNWKINLHVTHVILSYTRFYLQKYPLNYQY